MSAPQPSVDQFHLWCDDLPEPVVLASREGEILAANPRFSRFAGSRKILGCQLSEFSPASADAVDRYIEACAAAQGPVQGSLLLRDETGAEVTYPCLGRAMDFSLPSAGRYVLVRLLPAAEPFRRPGEFPRTEEELRNRVEQLAHAEARVRSVVENAVDGIITIDEKGTVLTVNPAAEKIFDYTAEEMIGRNVKFLMPEPYHSQHDRYLTNYLQTGQAKIIGIGREVTGRRKDGSQFPMYLGVSEFRLDGRRCFTGIVQDISERKRAENISHFLADASRSLAAVVDYASTLQKVAYLAVPFFAEWCMIHIVRDDGSLHQLAAAHVHPNQSELAQQVGRRCTVYPSGPVGPGHIIKTGNSELIDEVSDSLIENVAPDPELRRLLKQFGLKSYVGAPLTVRGKVVGVLSFYSADPKRKYDKLDLAVAEDLALRSATAVENALLYGELRDADRRKDDFLAMLAHELRNPLAPIRSGLDLLAMDGAEPDVVRVMQQQTEHMVRLVDDLLDVSRILRGKVHLQPEPIDIRTAVQRAIDAVRLANVAAGHELTVSMPPDPIYVYADPVRLTQVITNLLTNSNKYTVRGGHIELSVRQEDQQSVAVSVRDDGIGILRGLAAARFRPVHASGSLAGTHAGGPGDRTHVGADAGRDASWHRLGVQRGGGERERVHGPPAGS